MAKSYGKNSVIENFLHVSSAKPFLLYIITNGVLALQLVQEHYLLAAFV